MTYCAQLTIGAGVLPCKGATARVHRRGLKFSFALRYKYLALNSLCHPQAQYGNTWAAFFCPF